MVPSLATLEGAFVDLTLDRGSGENRGKENKHRVRLASVHGNR